MREQSCKRIGSRGCKADVGQGHRLKGVAILPIVILPAYRRLLPRNLRLRHGVENKASPMRG